MYGVYDSRSDTSDWVFITTRNGVTTSKASRAVADTSLLANWPLPRPKSKPFSDVCNLKHVWDHKIRRRGRKGRKGFSLVKRNHCSHHSTYTHLLNRIHFIMFHCVKLSMSLAICLKLIYRVCSFSMGSVNLLGEQINKCKPGQFRAVLHSSPLVPWGFRGLKKRTKASDFRSFECVVLKYPS